MGVILSIGQIELECVRVGARHVLQRGGGGGEGGGGMNRGISESLNMNTLFWFIIY